MGAPGHLKGPGVDSLVGLVALVGLSGEAEPVPARNQMPLWLPARPPAQQASLLPAAPAAVAIATRR